MEEEKLWRRKKRKGGRDKKENSRKRSRKT